MKKLLLVTLVVLLAFGAVSALAVPSKTVEDMVSFDTAVIYTAESEEAQQELETLIEEGTEAYLGDEVVAEAKALLESDEIEINEFMGIFVGEYDETMGDVNVKATFATPYEAGEKLCIAIGVSAEEGYAWTLLEGTANEENTVEFLLPGELITELNANGGLLAVINAK